MNILFYNGNAIQPTKGGISRITYTLGELFKNQGHFVYYATLKPYSGNDCVENQLFLDEECALESLVEVVKSHDINIIINQFQFSKRIVDLLYSCKERCPGLKIISCYHNSILTPIYNIAYQREVSLKQKHLSLLFEILKLKDVNNLIVRYYIHRHRNEYINVYDKSDAVIVLCEGQRDELQKMLGIKESDKVYVIYNTYSPQSVIPKPKRKRVIWVGTFDIMVKRPDIMIKAWAKIYRKYPDWELYMLGDGPALDSMKSFVVKLNLKNIYLTGRVGPEPYYEEASIHCITSTHECFPMVILEAKANECASIATNCFTSAPLLIQDEVNGRLIKPFSPTSLAEALDALMSNPVELSTMQKNALKDIEKFSGENVYKNWIKLFQDIDKNVISKAI